MPALPGGYKSRSWTSDRKSPTTQVPPRPIFLPFWTYDIDGDVSWRGWQISTQNRKFIRVPVAGTVPLYYDDVLVPATHSLSADLLSKLRYDMRSIAPYSPDSLASWPAEIYSVSVADGSVAALERAYKSPETQALISNSISSAGNIEDLQVESPRVSVTGRLMPPVLHVALDKLPARRAENVRARLVRRAVDRGRAHPATDRGSRRRRRTDKTPSGPRSGRRAPDTAASD